MENAAISAMISRYALTLSNRNVREEIIVHIGMCIRVALILIWGFVFKGVVVN
jgi:hypothetical protein